jgi:hypothetical protein
MATATTATPAPITGERILGSILAFRQRIRVRLLHPGEALPTAWDAGFDLIGALDPDWVWVAYRDSELLGALVASPVHSAAFIWRLVAPGPSASTVTRRLLHQFLHDAHARGCCGYVTAVNLAIPVQSALARVIQRAGGGISSATNLTFCAGPLPARGGHSCHS